jgi:nucleoside-diphosphate-sugar epimerase
MTLTHETVSPKGPAGSRTAAARERVGSVLGELPSRYLVTGCAGFIGSHLVDVLLDGGQEVVGVDSFSDYYPRQTKEANIASALGRAEFTLVDGDLTALDLRALVGGVAGVFHLAARPGVRSSWGDPFSDYLRDNLLATQRLFEAAVEAGIRVVFASSSSVYGNAERYPTAEDDPLLPISPYGVTKLACEHLARAYGDNFGLEVVALRYFTVYGPRQRPDMAFCRIIEALRTGTPFHLTGTGEQSRDFTFVGDAVAATLAAMKLAAPGTVYNVGGGSEATLNDVLGLAEKLGGRRLEVGRGPASAGDVYRTAADTSRIRTELGWEPQTPLAEGLAAQLAETSDALPRAPELVRLAREL